MIKKLLNRLQFVSTANKLAAVGVAVTLGLVGYMLVATGAIGESGPKLYLQPGSGSYTVDPNHLQTLELEVRLDTAGEEVNAVQADLHYPEKNLRYISVEEYESAFEIAAESEGGDGVINIARGNITSVSGDVLVATVKFEILPVQGNKKSKVTVGFADTSRAISASDNQDILESAQPGQYTTQNAKQPKGRGPNR